MATRVYESAVLDAGVDRVWQVVHVLDFHFLPSVAKCDLEGKGVTHNTVGGVRRVQYKDGTVQRIKLLELSESHYYVTYDVIESTPPLTYSGATHTIKLRRITEDHHTFVQFTSDYAKDAGNDVIADSRFKKIEFFKALAGVTEPRSAQFLKKIDFSNFKKLTAAQIDEAWNTFDTDRNGTLDPAEVESVVSGIVAKINEQTSAVQDALTHLFEVADAPTKEDKKDVKASSSAKDDKAPAPAAAAAAAAPAPAAAAAAGKDNKEDKKAGHKAVDKKQLSKKVLSEVQKQVKAAAKSLLGQLDKNKDGKIDKAEFVVLFPRWLEREVAKGIRGAYF